MNSLEKKTEDIEIIEPEVIFDDETIEKKYNKKPLVRMCLEGLIPTATAIQHWSNARNSHNRIYTSITRGMIYEIAPLAMFISPYLTNKEALSTYILLKIIGSIDNAYSRNNIIRKEKNQVRKTKNANI